MGFSDNNEQQFLKRFLIKMKNISDLTFDLMIKT
jgi:uncharacterized protein with PhoU and TrkA domain